MKRLEDRIMEIFEKTDRAISPDTLGFVTRSNHHDVWEKLRQLEKRGLIVPVTERRIRFYKWARS